MKPIKLTIVGYLFEGILYTSREAWQFAKEKAEKAKNHSLLAKAIKLIVKEDKLKEAKEKLSKFGYSFQRWVQVQKAKAEYYLFINGLSKQTKSLILN
jgi:hypothetical protein